jgi:hypothetical protein
VEAQVTAAHLAFLGEPRCEPRCYLGVKPPLCSCEEEPSMETHFEMTMEIVLTTSRQVLGELLGTTSFRDVALGTIQEPVTLGGLSYSLRYYAGLTGHPAKVSPVAYTFFVATPPAAVRERFAAEVRRQAAGQAFDESVIASYYLPFVPGRTDFQELIGDLTNVLHRGLFVGKPYEFAFHMACPTADWDMAIVFVEVNSIAQVAREFMSEAE